MGTETQISIIIIYRKISLQTEKPSFNLRQNLRGQIWKLG